VVVNRIGKVFFQCVGEDLAEIFELEKPEQSRSLFKYVYR